jgi:hypothetical protein
MTISGEIWRIVPSAPHIMASSGHVLDLAQGKYGRRILR